MGVYDSFKVVCKKTGKVDYPQTKMFDSCLNTYKEGDSLVMSGVGDFILVLKNRCLCGRPIKVIVRTARIIQITCDPIRDVVFETSWGGHEAFSGYSEVGKSE